MLTLTLVIPVYNEERHIKACLDAIVKQTIMPDEVLVIDNNCTDKTVEIAKRYPFVTVIREPKQGLIHARNTGFNRAKGDILGRIDADSVIANNWVETVLKNFAGKRELAGLTGIAKTAIIPYVNSVTSTFFSRAYFRSARGLFKTEILWGANMAIRRNAWEKVKTKVGLNCNEVHEDQDLSLWIASEKMQNHKDNNLLVYTNGQEYSYLPKLVNYHLKRVKTKRAHIRNGNYGSDRIQTLNILSVVINYLLTIPAAFYIYVCALLIFPVEFIHNRGARRL